MRLQWRNRQLHLDHAQQQRHYHRRNGTLSACQSTPQAPLSHEAWPLYMSYRPDVGRRHDAGSLGTFLRNWTCDSARFDNLEHGRLQYTTG